MLSIDSKNKIKLTAGDTMTLTVNIRNGDEAYEPQEGDSCRFAVSKGYLGQDDYEFILEKTVPMDSLTFTLPAQQTKALDIGTYNYDVELTHSDGTIETFISSTLTITGEVK